MPVWRHKEERVCHSPRLHSHPAETGTAASDYIQLYHGDAKLLQESLEVVQQTAGVLLGALIP